MNQLTASRIHFMKVLTAATAVSLLLASCASTPTSPPGSADVRAKLTRLQSDTNLASNAPLEIKEAEAAVRLAEVPVPKDPALGQYRVYLADHAVDIATAKASTRYVEGQRVQLSDQREQARLLARTREADMARRETGIARSEADKARSDAAAARASQLIAADDAEQRAELARTESARERAAVAADAAYQIELARNDAAAAHTAKEEAVADAEKQAQLARAEYERERAAIAADAANQVKLARNDADKERALAAEATAKANLEAAELQRQITLLQAKTTERGLVLTLGNVLFATGRADLKSGATDNLNRLVAFLNQYPERNAVIEGHTDNVGSDVSNQSLSQRRAESVKSYLLQQGISSQRLSSSGMGESHPIADNNTETGRQQNRRVEIIIDNPPVVVAAR